MSKKNEVKSKKVKTKKPKTMKVKVGETVSIHYVGTLDDGTEFDSSRTRDEVLSFEVGSGQLIPGFDDAVSGMKVGQVKKVKLSPEEAYGEVNPEAIQSVPNSAFPADFELQEGLLVQGHSPQGEPVVAKVESIEQDSVVLDFNHPLAGKNLNFEIELLSIESKKGEK